MKPLSDSYLEDPEPCSCPEAEALKARVRELEAACAADIAELVDDAAECPECIRRTAEFGRLYGQQDKSRAEAYALLERIEAECDRFCSPGESFEVIHKMILAHQAGGS